ncbi:MAG: ATP-binding protein [Pseudomonadota bacterium]
MKARLRARFRLLATLQALLLGLTLALLGLALTSTDHVAVPLVLGIIATFQLMALVRFVERHVETLEEFFSAVNYEDLAKRFVTDDLDAELKRAFNRILARFGETRAQRDLQANYLETVVRHVPVPLIAVRHDGSVTFMNQPARRLTGITALADLNELSTLDPDLAERMQAIEPGDQRLLQTRLRGIPAELRVSVAQIRSEERTERIYSLENLSGELTERESTAWRNLIRVLTHEIMNTLTPVTSLANTCDEMLGEEDSIDDVREAIQTIARRSEGLMGFVARYREVLRVPRPKVERLPVHDVLQAAVRLSDDKLRGVDVQLSVTPESLQVNADPQLLDQVLINLLKNATDALAGVDSPKLQLTARLHHGRVIIEVTDNGPGISKEVLEQIFVPFFTTKREGSGIGLSLSRQIMSAHGGAISVSSGERGTQVTLAF